MLRKFALSPEIIGQCLKRVPDEDVYPVAPPTVETLELSGGDGDDARYLKGPKLRDGFLGTGQWPKVILGEVEVLERLRLKPHPNVVRYHGCLVRRGRVVGIVLDRLEATLYQRLEKRKLPFDVKACMDSMRSATEHLHSLGLAHNDLSPANVMVDGEDKVFFNRSFGDKLITAGTRGWIDDEFYTSDAEHDRSAPDKITKWLHKTVTE